MAQTPTAALAAINVGTIQVGATGTIGSLMTWELESMKHAKPAQEPPPRRLKTQSPPVSVPCGATPRRLLPRRNLPNEAVSSSGSRTRTRPGGPDVTISSGRSSCSSSTSSADVAPVQKILTTPDDTRQTPRKNGGRSPALSAAGRMDRDGPRIKERAEKKDQRLSFLVEVVDLKCNNPMSSRLKKLGFSKLSESIA